MPEKDHNPNPTIPTLRRLMKIARGQKVWLFAALLIELILAGLVVLNAQFTRSMFDAVQARQSPAFWHYAWLTLAFSVPNFILPYFRVMGAGLFSERTQAKLRQAVAAQSAAVPMDYLEKRHSGDLLSVLNADLVKVKTLLANNILDFFGQIFRFVAALAYIISINWLLTLVSTLAIPAVFLVISALTRPITRRSEEMQDEIGQVNALAQDGLSGAMLVKSFNLAGLLDQRFHLANQKALKKGLRIAWLWSIITGAGFGFIILPFIIAFGLGGYLVIDHQMTFGGLFVFINLLNFVVNPLGNLPGVIASIGESTGAAQRVFKLLDHPTERKDGHITQPAAASAPAIQFNDITFAYGEGSPVLKNIHLDIHKGQTVAIVGPSGGGKSTLLKLILGYYPLPDDSLRLFGEDLNRWKLNAARQQMAVVAQETYLFPVSIAENIRCGKPDASQDEVEQAARAANMHDFILSLPEGYQTDAGEWGARFSGGQKQRISLARAILKDAPILLLDEPTSALDAESEALIQEALERFTHNRTTLVVAHRLSTIKNASRVIVLQEGVIVEEGTHTQLLAQGGLYLDLYQRQFNPDQTGPNPTQEGPHA